jgi:hypothetical protein
MTVLALIASLGASPLLAQDFFDFGRIPGLPEEPNVEVQLNSALLAFVSEAAKGNDPDIGDALAGLEAIRVRVYEDLVDGVAVAKFVDDASGRLERAGWQRTVYVRDGDDKVRMYVRMADQRMTGMTVMVVDSSDAVFINIAGSIDPAQLGRIARVVGAGDVFGGRGGGQGARGRRPGGAAGDPESAGEER